jgi:hypothetical protein
MTETAEVVAAIRELQEVTLWIQQRTAGMNLPGDRRSRMAFGCLDLAIEHQAGIAVLADQPFWGAAFALLRCALDALVRGVWLARCASDADLEAFKQRGLRDKSFADLAAEVEKALGHTRGVLTRVALSSWGVLSDFTHTGFQHVVRRNSATHTGPNYPDSEKIHALRLATAIGLLATVEFAGLSGNREIATAANERAKAVIAARGSGESV